MVVSRFISHRSALVVEMTLISAYEFLVCTSIIRRPFRPLLVSNTEEAAAHLQSVLIAFNDKQG